MSKSTKLPISTSPDNREKQKSAFGEALDKVLSAHQVSNAALASGVGVDPAHLHRQRFGSRYVSGPYVDQISSTLGLNDRETTELHRAAAKDAGFKLDLTKPKS